MSSVCGADEARAEVIAAYDARGGVSHGALDEVVRFAAQLCEAPVAIVTWIDGATQYFLARNGVDVDRTETRHSFCQFALASGDYMEVCDATEDPRFIDNPYVTGDLNVRFYAGMPLISPEGIALGTVCILDTAPRPAGLTAFQREGLRLLADLAMARLGDRRVSLERSAEQNEAQAAIADSALRFRILADTMPQMVWSTLPDGFHDYYNARWYEFTGVPQGTTDGEGWNGMFHPEDQDRAWARWRHSLESGDPYAIEYRLRHRDGTYRWVLGRALPIRDPDTGAITRWFGTCTDIHEQKLALEEREIISQELSHRIKNIFAVVSGLIAFAARARPEFAPVATDLRERVTALGRAHDFVRPHSAQSRPSAQQDSLKGLMAELFSPYQQAGDDRIRVQGGDLSIDDRSATPLALLFHELATNATKYGALSNDEGHVVVSIDSDGVVARLGWREYAGPAVSAPSGAGGFGSQLIEMSAVRQMGGTVTRSWDPDGLALEIAVPLSALTRQPAN
ncbi:Histidine kinase [Sphingomonas sp. EC-HK361]|uniref:sensor histidine kinase n=1 Tax=Sphingomonas sp. EC-HK361 TaxID=2038397 RepID=UPI0012515603|nr:PAS domain-containing protein [Sphingomonas sp. EC-HK361]VVS97979.1 Histidine kinase [Sphingomonas sp. EC-HK361]